MKPAFLSPPQSSHPPETDQLVITKECSLPKFRQARQIFGETISLMESAVRFIRLVQVAMLAGIVGSAVVGEFLRSAHPPDGTFFQILSLVAVSIVGATVVVRRTLVLPTEITLNRKPDDALAIAHWRGGYVLLYAMCEAIALLGLVLRLLDFPLLHVFGFYLGGFLLLLLFSPRPPERQFR